MSVSFLEFTVGSPETANMKSSPQNYNSEMEAENSYEQINQVIILEWKQRDSLILAQQQTVILYITNTSYIDDFKSFSLCANLIIILKLFLSILLHLSQS